MIRGAQIYLSVVCGAYIIISFLINFTFLTTLLKLRRLNDNDKSNGFLTHLILADFIAALFILIPSAFGIYNGSYLDSRACHLQVFFVTFYLSLTFYGMLALSIERYFKFKYPLSHINFFTRRQGAHCNNEALEHQKSKKAFFKVLLIIFFLWLLNILIGLIPLFNNADDVEYFEIQSQCDYRYENFKWWIWFYFFFSLTIPFLASVIFFGLTFKLIIRNAKTIKITQSKHNPKKKFPKKSDFGYLMNLFFPRTARKSNAVEKLLDRKNNKNNKSRVSDTTKLPENIPYYSHLINIESLEDGHENIYNDIHVRKQLLVQFKYDTERSKTATFFIITVLSYCLIFPVFVIHFYRTYNFDGTTYDNADVVRRGVYSTFVWISYLMLILKSTVCLLHNKFYRYSLYQSANLRGFHGDYDYEVERFKKELNKFEKLFDDDKDSSKRRNQKKNLIDSEA